MRTFRAEARDRLPLPPSDFATALVAAVDDAALADAEFAVDGGRARVYAIAGVVAARSAALGKLLAEAAGDGGGGGGGSLATTRASGGGGARSTARRAVVTMPTVGLLLLPFHICRARRAPPTVQARARAGRRGLRQCVR